MDNIRVGRKPGYRGLRSDLTDKHYPILGPIRESPDGKISASLWYPTEPYSHIPVERLSTLKGRSLRR
jgi:hypothetical protein